MKIESIVETSYWDLNLYEGDRYEIEEVWMKKLRI